MFRFSRLFPIVGGTLVLGVIVGCSSEDAAPVDLDETSVSSPIAESGGSDTPGDVPPSDDPTNAASSALARRYAEQQCFDDPDAEEGVIEIVHPESNSVVARIVADCADVRAEHPDGLPDPPPTTERNDSG